MSETGKVVGLFGGGLSAKPKPKNGGKIRKPAKIPGVMTNEPGTETTTKQKLLLIVGTGLIVALVFSGTIFGVNLVHQDKALPRTELSGIDVGGKSRPELIEVANDLDDQLRIIITNDGKTAQPTLAELNVQLDRNKTADNAITLNGTRNMLTPFLIWQPHLADVSAKYDAASLKEYLKKAFPDSFSDPTDARIEWNGESNSFQAIPAIPERLIDPEQLIQSIDRVLSSPTTNKTAQVAVKTTQRQPVINDTKAAEAVDYINARLGRAIQLYVDGRIAYHSTPAEIADWVKINFNRQTSKYDVAFDVDKIEQKIRSDMAGSVSDATRDQINFASSDGRTIVLQAGQSGYGVTNAREAAEAINQALDSNQDLNYNLAFDRTDFQTQTIQDTGEHWMEVNLTNQTATMHSGDVAIMTYSISSGKPGIGVTYPGTFHITWQARIRDMPDMPNVEWISYFDVEGRAFHATYWHSNFGQPMSHGCINMTYLAAEAVYWFVQPGSRVEIHW